MFLYKYTITNPLFDSKLYSFSFSYFPTSFKTQLTMSQMSNLNNSSSSNDRDSIKPYPDEEALGDYGNGNGNGSEHSNGLGRKTSNLLDFDNDLIRTVSNYTLANIISGEAAEKTYSDEKLIDEGKLPPPPPPKYGIFAPENRSLMKSFLLKYIVVIIAFWTFILSVWSIYWGSMYHRENRLINLGILVNVETDISLPVSQAMYLSTIDPSISTSLSWHFNSNLTEDEIIQLVHDQKYWGAIYVTSNNVSNQLINAFNNGENLNTSNFVKSYYETGRDPNTMGSTVEPTLYRFQSVFLKYLQSVSYPSILNNLSTNQFANLQNTNLLSSYPIIEYTNGRPTTLITIAPLQVGLIYIIIITFFDVMWTTPLYGAIASKIYPMHYIILRMVISQISYLFISLAFTTLNAAFQINMNQTWKGGFGVFWMISYLTMSAVGGANQNVSLILFSTFPPLMGFWMLFFVIINISATFSPIPLCPDFFRFTYAMPIKNAYELLKVVLFDTARLTMGRDFGILIAWGAANLILLPFCMLFFANRMKSKMIKETKKQIQLEKEGKKV